MAQDQTRSILDDLTRRAAGLGPYAPAVVPPSTDVPDASAQGDGTPVDAPSEAEWAPVVPIPLGDGPDATIDYIDSVSGPDAA